MSSVNDVVNALKAKVDELGSFISELHVRADAAHADALAARSDLALAQLENHDLRNQLQVVQLSATEYDPAVDLQSVIDHLDVLMGRAAQPAAVEVISPELTAPAAGEIVHAEVGVDAPVDHAEEVAPLEIPPFIVEDSPVESTAEER